MIANIEKSIAEFGKGARRQLEIDEMQGATFTIADGSIYGSLVHRSRAFLGMCKIQERPVVAAGSRSDL